MIATFSLHTVVNDVGAYCGLAALIGLALMILLYFAQAREVRRLSAWIEDEEERRRTMPGPVARVTVGAPVPGIAVPTAAPRTPVPPAPPVASGTVSTAVPGVRRVAVPGGTATMTPAPAATAVLAPATAAALAAVPAPVGVEGLGQGADVAAPGAKAVALPVAASPPAAGAMPEPAGDQPTDADRTPDPGGDQAAGTGPGTALTAQAPRPAAAGTPDPTEAPAEGAAGARAAQDASAEGASAASADAPATGAVAPAVPPAAVEDDGPPTGELTVPSFDQEPAPAAPPAAGAAPARPAQAAVPLASRRLPTAEPRRVKPAGAAPGGVSPSPFDLLRAERPQPPGALADAAPDGGVPGLRPLTPAGARPRFPPAPARIQPLREDEVTARVPGLGAPGVDQTEPRRRRSEPDEEHTEPRGRRREPDDDYVDPPRSFGATLRLLAVAIVIVAILIFVATRIFNSGGGTPAGTHTTTTQTTSNGSHSTTTTSGVVPSSITVAVLNGTTKVGLARGAWTVLAGKGFVKGGVANAPSQADATSSVGYTHGHRKAALAIAQDLAISTTAVAPVDPATLADAKRHGARPQVVVTLGADYASR